MTEIRNNTAAFAEQAVLVIAISDFGFVSDFEIRISDFEFNLTTQTN